MADAKPLSKRAQRVLLLASLESKRSGCAHVASEHLLLGALAYRSRTVSAELTKAGLRLATLRSYIAEVGSAPESSLHGYGPSMHGALRRSVEHSEVTRSLAIEPEHLLLGVLDEEAGGAARVLCHFGVDAAAVKRTVIKRLKK